MYLDDCQARVAAGSFGIGYVDLPFPVQCQLQKKFIAAQNGPVVTKLDGHKVDARDVPNGRGGKKDHRVVHNRLTEVGEEVGSSELFHREKRMKLQMEEATKQSLMDGEECDFNKEMELARKRSLNEMKYGCGNMTRKNMNTRIGRRQKNQWEEGGEDDRKMPAKRMDLHSAALLNDDIIEIDDDYDEKKRSFSLCVENETITDGRAAEMYARSKDRMMREYKKELDELSKMMRSSKNSNDNDKEEKKRMKKQQVKKLKQRCMRLAEEEKKGDHINLIKRVTSNGKELFGPNVIQSQEVVELIQIEYELDEDE